MSNIVIHSPLAGWALPLAQVSDPVFAQGMAGDGLAIDPTGDVLHAPFDGEIVPMAGAKHAITIRSDAGHDILMHVGIDTVQLGGAGFVNLVQPGQRVRAGQALLRFDLDQIARRARSTVTPILLASEGIVLRRNEGCLVAVGEFLMEVAAGGRDAGNAGAQAGNGASRFYNVAFDHGLHARPAATLVAAVRAFDATMTLVSRGRTANAKSTVAIMSLGVHCGETIEVRAQGRDAVAALDALDRVLAVVPELREDAPLAAVSSVPLSAERPDHIRGVMACGGVAVGVAAQLAEAELPVVEIGKGAAFEQAALDAAIAGVLTHLQGLSMKVPAAQQSILAAHVELVQDPELAARAGQWLERGKSAGFAWRSAVHATIDALRELGDAHMLERVADLRDLENQVLRVLAGMPAGAARELPARAILLADELLPSQLVMLDKGRIAGICTARGGPTSHVAIIAAAMDIPALVAAGASVLAVPDGTPLLLDADAGVMRVNPPVAERETFERELARRQTERTIDVAAAQRDAITTDGVRIHVLANLGALAEAAPAVANGAEGCGLLRSEFLFLERHAPPDEEEQTSVYQAIAAALGQRPLTMRTMDIGGDKPIPYLPLPREDNPALGLRGLRTSLWKPQLLRTQLRAMLRVQPATGCRILIPMVTDLDDIRTVRALLRELEQELGMNTTPLLGAMIETPASALLADQLLDEVDFLSIGTNDLSQYVLAMDRGHQALAARLDALHPAVLRLIAAVASAANARGKEVAVCGGLGSDPVAVPLLIGLGVHEISAVPTKIPGIKRLIRGLDTAECATLAGEAVKQPNAAAVRSLVGAWLSRTTAIQTGSGD